ncbi:MAG: hypothetical protein KIT73_05065 [Burkholderiales bacterium]|nr:hypothetical protein [Burkholderiales bacterium]
MKTSSLFVATSFAALLLAGLVNSPGRMVGGDETRLAATDVASKRIAFDFYSI